MDRSPTLLLCLDFQWLLMSSHGMEKSTTFKIVAGLAELFVLSATMTGFLFDVPVRSSAWQVTDAPSWMVFLLIRVVISPRPGANAFH